MPLIGTGLGGMVSQGAVMAWITAVEVTGEYQIKITFDTDFDVASDDVIQVSYGGVNWEVDAMDSAGANWVKINYFEAIPNHAAWFANGGTRATLVGGARLGYTEGTIEF